MSSRKLLKSPICNILEVNGTSEPNSEMNKNVTTNRHR